MSELFEEDLPIEIEEECYGKHCDMTSNDTPLKLEIGWNRSYCLDGKRFAPNLYCDYCEKENCYAKCVSCSETYKLTDMEYRCGGLFTSDDAYGVDCMFCKNCVKNIQERM
jgi:hypothetical protein